MHASSPGCGATERRSQLRVPCSGEGCSAPLAAFPLEHRPPAAWISEAEDGCLGALVAHHRQEHAQVQKGHRPRAACGAAGTHQHGKHKGWPNSLASPHPIRIEGL